MIQALSLAFAQLSDPRIQKVIGISIAIAFVVFGGLMIGGWFLIDWLTGLNGWWADAAHFLGFFAVLVIAWFTFPIVTATTAALFSDQVVDAVMARHYPNATHPYKVAIPEMLLDGVKLAAIALVVNVFTLPLLFFPPVYAVVAYGLNGYLLGREYFEMPAFRRLPRADAKALFQRHRARFVLAGVVIAFLATIPVLNLIAPIVGIAFMVHIFESVVNLGPRRG
ncbi:EI24 domain-containing protein [Dongia rigui]|uniref:EI24 domain-containing protein n=1 Tax=Dongia rigui TaxID=940149 RepID=A0ABU5E012_9PROT|nr:EI24 domain-containing protein [Dongia rigui]MDY0872131.1 EI24 domain-containing protein [Dongia rigui]